MVWQNELVLIWARMAAVRRLSAGVWVPAPSRRHFPFGRMLVTLTTLPDLS